MYLMAGEVWKEGDPFSGDPVAIQTIFSAAHICVYES